MSEMVERVAKALCAADENPDNWDDLPDNHPLWGADKYLWRSRARTAIQAMRDPPEEVLTALNSMAQCIGYLPEGWNLAIDTALKS